MKWSAKRMSAGQIAEGAMQILKERNCEVWRQNNLSVKGRKFIGKKGIADISGYVKGTGIRVECEVKADGDTLSDDQMDFLFDFKGSGGWAFVARQNELGYVELYEYHARIMR